MKLERFSIKLTALLLVCALSLALAARFGGQRVAEMEARTVDSLAQALLEASARSALEGALEQAETQLAEAGKAVHTVDLSPVRPEGLEPGSTVTSFPGGIPWETVMDQELNRAEQSLVSLLLRTPLAGAGVDQASLSELVLDLKLHYFLDGYYFCKAETDPARYAKKRAVWHLESAVIDSLYRLAELADGLDLRQLDFSRPAELLAGLDGEALLADALALRARFEAEPAGDFPALKEAISVYFDQYVTTCTGIRDLLEAAKGASNDLLGAAALLGRIEGLYIQALDTVDAGLRMKDLTNPIYAEGVDGLEVYSRPLVYRKLAGSGLQIPVTLSP